MRVVEEGAYKFFVMEELPAGTLADRLNRGATLGVKEAARIMVEVTAGLAALHAAGQVHGAVRPDRIWLPRQARLGWPRSLWRDPLTAVGLHATTDIEPAAVAYCPPECTSGAAPRPAGDMYSLGCTLYQMLGGRVPFGGETPDELLAAHRQATPVALEELNPAVPKALATMVARLLAKQPDARDVDGAACGSACSCGSQAGRVCRSTNRSGARVRLDAWLAEHGQLPADNAAVVPLAIAPADDFPSASKGRGTNPRRRRSLVALLAGVLAAILVAAGAGAYLLSSGWTVASPRPGMQTPMAPAAPPMEPPAAPNDGATDAMPSARANETGETLSSSQPARQRKIRKRPTSSRSSRARLCPRKGWWGSIARCGPRRLMARGST